jgi:hypothetical protein
VMHTGTALLLVVWLCNMYFSLYFCLLVIWEAQNASFSKWDMIASLEGTLLTKLLGATFVNYFSLFDLT